MLIIPAIDIIDGKCVRLSQGNYAVKTVYSDTPLDIAKKFENAGATHLHLVDLDGAQSGSPVNTSIIQKICSQTQLSIDVGGGIKSLQQATELISRGVNQVNIGSLAAKKPQEFCRMLQELGSEKVILSADVLNKVVKINGWQDEADYEVDEFLSLFTEHGLTYTTITDISRDGMMQGPSLSLYSELIKVFPSLKFIASGGVSSEKDIEKLKTLPLHGCIVGKAFYENKISLNILSS